MFTWLKRIASQRVKNYLMWRCRSFFFLSVFFSNLFIEIFVHNENTSVDYMNSVFHFTYTRIYKIKWSDKTFCVFVCLFMCCCFWYSKHLLYCWNGNEKYVDEKKGEWKYMQLIWLDQMACRCVVVIVTSENLRTNLKIYPHQDCVLTTTRKWKREERGWK